MKISRIDAHDRLLEFGKQADYISKGCQECIDNRPDEFEMNPFYIFAHKRELGQDEKWSLFVNGGYLDLKSVPTHRMIWIPRLRKPEAQENSMLFKYYPIQDIVKVIWMIPDKELWDTYSKGKLTENKIVSESIHAFKKDKRKLELDEEDDLSEKEAHKIYRQIAQNKMNGSKIQIINP